MTFTPSDISIKGPTEYRWVHPDVYNDDLKIQMVMETYTQEEIDQLLLDKANKYVPTAHANIAILDSTGDLLDSGVGIDGLYFNVVSGGTF